MKTKTDSRPDRWRTRRASGPGVVGGRPGGGAGGKGEGKQGVPSIEGAREEGAIAGHRGRRRRELGRKGRGSSALRRAPARFHGHRVAIRPLFRVTREGGSTCPVPPLPSRPPSPPLSVTPSRSAAARSPPFSAAWHSARELSADTLCTARALLTPLSSLPLFLSFSLSLSLSLSVVSSRRSRLARVSACRRAFHPVFAPLFPRRLTPESRAWSRRELRRNFRGTRSRRDRSLKRSRDLSASLRAFRRRVVHLYCILTLRRLVVTKISRPDVPSRTSRR